MTNKKHFVLKLIPPRPTFAQDMTADERAIMQQHLVYWADLMQKGIALVYGPVLDNAYTYGLGIVEVNNEAEVQHITANDPAARINRYEIAPMMAILPQQ